MKGIDPAGKVRAHLDRLIDWRRGTPRAPVTVEWDLSNRCVLGCQDCHFAHTHSRGPWVSQERRLPMAFDSTGDLADMAVVYRGLRQMADMGVQGIVWSGGGEPTTHPQWLTAVALAKEAGLEQGLYTYGGGVDAQAASALRESLAWAVVSLDCPDAASYTAEKGVPAARFHAACDGASRLAGGPMALGISFLIQSDNWRRMGEMLRLGRSLGASYVTFRPAIRVGPLSDAAPSDAQWITEAERSLTLWSLEPNVVLDVDRFRAYRDWTGRSYDACKGIQLSTTVTPDGRVWLCPQRRGIEGSCLGSLADESFADIWARHPGQWTDFSTCRTMCRLHQVNEQIAALEWPVLHEAFV